MNKKATIRVFGMTCDDCAVTVKKGLLSAEGVKDVRVYLKDGIAEVLLDDAIVNPEGLVKLPVFSGKSRYRAQLREVF
ncbi:MAG: heavy-metal-associated domain-containing protein [Nitrososphaeria archaeon]